MYNLLEIFSTDRRLLETRGSLIIRQLCMSLNTERIYRTLAEILEKEEVRCLTWLSDGVSTRPVLTAGWPGFGLDRTSNSPASWCRSSTSYLLRLRSFPSSESASRTWSQRCAVLGNLQPASNSPNAYFRMVKPYSRFCIDRGATTPWQFSHCAYWPKHMSTHRTCYRSCEWCLRLGHVSVSLAPRENLPLDGIAQTSRSRCSCWCKSTNLFS